jgi:hypothetical protein
MTATLATDVLTKLCLGTSAGVNDSGLSTINPTICHAQAQQVAHTPVKTNGWSLCHDLGK